MIPRGSLVKKAGIQIDILEYTGDLPGNAQSYDPICKSGPNDRTPLFRALQA